MPLLLALDTSTSTASVAVFDGQRVLSETTWLAGREHSSRLLVEAEAALARVGRQRSELTGLVVARGPGSFTGVRVALSVAKGIAAGLAIPAWGVSTLDVLAEAARTTELPPRAGLADVAGAAELPVRAVLDNAPGATQLPVRPDPAGATALTVGAALAGVGGAMELPVRAVLEAGRGRFATALYRGGACVGPAQLATLEQLIGLTREPALLIGELDPAARARLAAETPAVLAPPAASLRRAGYAAALGWRQAQAGAPGDPQALDAIYVSDVSDVSDVSAVGSPGRVSRVADVTGAGSATPPPGLGSDAPASNG